MNGMEKSPDSNSIINSGSVAFGTGAILGASSTWLGRKFVEITDLTNQMDRLPRVAVRSLIDLARTLAKPVVQIHAFSVNTCGISENMFSYILAPILEEAIYRYGLQEGIKLSLTTIGFPTSIAQAAGISVASVMFGTAHDYGFGGQFATLTICGTIFGVIKESYGFPEAVVAHAFHNIVIDLLAGFRE